MSTEKTFITGASSGIGLHLAHEFAKHGHPLVLVAPVEAELAEIAKALADEYGVPVTIIARNLEDDSAVDEIFERVSREEGELDILVNNAGHGLQGPFSEIPIERDLSTVRLNVEAVLRLTKLFLPSMIRRGRGRILNVASVAAFEPGLSLPFIMRRKRLCSPGARRSPLSLKTLVSPLLPCALVRPIRTSSQRLIWSERGLFRKLI